MIRRILRIAIRLGLLAGLGYGVAVTLRRRDHREPAVAPPSWPPVTPPAPTPSATEAPAPAQAWVSPSSDGTCPETHPIKAKQSSKIFHLPGMFAYDRTTPDRCYATEAAAEADGFRKAKR